MITNRLLLNASATVLFWTACTVLAADDSAALAGKWSVKKTNEEGQAYTQTIEIKKDKFTFQITRADDQVALYAEGDVKLDKHGPFNAIRFYHIRGGQSSDNLQDVDDEYNAVYVVDEDTWSLAMNFDKQHGQQKPGVDAYKRVKKPAAAAEQKK